jgi:hypothetical protein
MSDESALEDRLGLVARYYDLPRDQMAAIADLGKDARKPVCQSLGLSPSIVRTMVDYDRYPQARDILRALVLRGEDLATFTVLDFGCLVADYAVFFARQGARAAIYDGEEEVKFAQFRFSEAGLPLTTYTIPALGAELMGGKTLVVFGEVLEHLENPLVPIKDCIDSGVKYIFTSCYPFGDEEYFELSGHLRTAQELQSDCIRLLIEHYDAIPLRDKTVLWGARAAGAKRS